MGVSDLENKYLNKLKPLVGASQGLYQALLSDEKVTEKQLLNLSMATTKACEQILSINVLEAPHRVVPFLDKLKEYAMRMGESAREYREGLTNKNKDVLSEASNDMNISNALFEEAQDILNMSLE